MPGKEVGCEAQQAADQHHPQTDVPCRGAVPFAPRSRARQTPQRTLRAGCQSSPSQPRHPAATSQASEEEPCYRLRMEGSQAAQRSHLVVLLKPARVIARMSGARVRHFAAPNLRHTSSQQHAAAGLLSRGMGDALGYTKPHPPAWCGPCPCRWRSSTR